jgi:cytoskeletal protein RodZ
MTDIGSQLRTAREAKGLTLEQAFKATRIKTSYLEAIEANQLDALPGPVQARGFVRSYANYLGLDGEHLAALLDAHKAPVLEVRPVSVGAESTKPQTVIPPAKLPPPITKPIIAPPSKATVAASDKPADKLRPLLQVPPLARSPFKSASSGGGIPTWILIVGAVVLFVAGALLVISALSSAGQSPAPSDVPNVLNSIDGAAATDQTALAPLGSEPVSITLAADEHVWVRITIDGQTAFAGLLDPGSSQEWQAANEIIVETGNAAALKVTHQGQTNIVGKRGQIVARAWGRQGVTDVPLATGQVTPPANAVGANTAQ